MATLQLSITTARPASYLRQQFQAVKGPVTVANSLANYIISILGGSQGAFSPGTSSASPPSIAISVGDLTSGAIPASGTFTFSNVATAGDTVIVNGVTFTAVASGALANQFNVGISATTTATNLAASINASVSPFVQGYVTATSALGVVTVRSVFYGLAGNMITIAKGVDSGGVNAVSGAKPTGGVLDSSALTLNF